MRERTVTVATDPVLTSLFGEGQRRDTAHYLLPTARLMELAISDMRTRLAKGEFAGAA